jgi:hypothetical protein
MPRQDEAVHHLISIINLGQEVAFLILLSISNIQRCPVAPCLLNINDQHSFFEFYVSCTLKNMAGVYKVDGSVLF